MLAASPRRAEHIHLHVFVANLNVDLVVHHRIYKNRREARVPARLRIERGNAHQSVHPRLRPQKAVGVHPLDLEYGALDAGLFALAHVEYFHGKALSLRPACVHPHQHLGPVLRLGASGARGNLHLRVAKIIGALQQ